jgi:uncharacterized integral membrane protein (TIGR00698 family)
LALAAGLLFGVLNQNPWPQRTSQLARTLLKVSIVGLGFGMDPLVVLQAGRTSFVYTGIGIGASMALGLLLGRLLHVAPRPSFLISAGTSICGGSAIAAVCPILGAREEETAVSLTTVFVLNAVALGLFPAIGAALKLSQMQFGLWSALAIHDTSSVVGASLKYGPGALLVGTTVKLVRTLWIAPLSLITAVFAKSRGPVAWPWFVVLFILAAWIHTALPAADLVWKGTARMAAAGFSATLFLIGAGLTWKSVTEVGWRPLVLGLILWVAISSITLITIRVGWIHL